MKKVFICLGLVALTLTACTENSRVKAWGGEGTINLPANRKLVNVTWKEGQIWYLTKPMTKKDVAETYQFQEESAWGLVEGVYNIVESK